MVLSVGNVKLNLQNVNRDRDRVTAKSHVPQFLNVSFAPANDSVVFKSRILQLNQIIQPAKIKAQGVFG